MKRANGLNAYRRSVGERLSLLEQGAVRIETEQTKQTTRIEQLFERLDQIATDINERFSKQGRVNPVVIISCIMALIATIGLGFSVLSAALGVFWFVIIGQVNGQVNPVKSELAATTSQSNANTALINNRIMPDLTSALSENKSSETTERAFEGRLNRISDDLGRTKIRVTKQGQGLKEVETQFRLNDETRNIQFSEQQRVNSMIWNTQQQAGAKLPPYPVAPFYQPKTNRANTSDDGGEGEE